MKPKIMHAQLPITESVHLMASDAVEWSRHSFRIVFTKLPV